MWPLHKSEVLREKDEEALHMHGGGQTPGPALVTSQRRGVSHKERCVPANLTTPQPYKTIQRHNIMRNL